MITAVIKTLFTFENRTSNIGVTKNKHDPEFRILKQELTSLRPCNINQKQLFLKI